MAPLIITRGRPRSALPRRGLRGPPGFSGPAVPRRTVVGPCPTPSSSTPSTPTRDRLLVLAFALTGDLPGFARRGPRHLHRRLAPLAQGASGCADPESWVRPHVCTHAQRRHTARILHRDRMLDAGAAGHPRRAGQAARRLAQGAAAGPAHDHLGRARWPARSACPSTMPSGGCCRPRPSSPCSGEVPSTAVRPAAERWPRTAPTSAGRGPPSSAAPARPAAVPMPWRGSAWSPPTLVVSGFAVADSHGVRPTLEAAGHRITERPARQARPRARRRRRPGHHRVPASRGPRWRAPYPAGRGGSPAPTRPSTATLPCQREGVRRPEGDDLAGPQLHHRIAEGAGPPSPRSRPSSSRATPTGATQGFRTDDRVVRRVHACRRPSSSAYAG